MTNTEKKKIDCPHCSEEIFSTAKKCRHCGEWISSYSKPSRDPKGTYKKRVFFLVILLSLLFVLFLFFIGNQTSNDVSGFHSALVNYEKLIENGSDQSKLEIYRDYYSKQEQTLTDQEFLDSSTTTNYTLTINSYDLVGEYGVADLTYSYCSTSNCSTSKSQSRIFLKFFYDDGKWRMLPEDVLCPRDEPHAMKPEFKRVLSLIEQRLLGSNEVITGTLSEDIVEILNCVHVDYASSDNEMSGAEGYFLFQPGQSMEKMSIKVSPRYKIKDDVITSVLLVHELTHASQFVEQERSGIKSDCFQSEADAFHQQNWYQNQLLEEEFNSIKGRIIVNNTPELSFIVDTFINVPKYPGYTYSEKALNFVKSNPAYQEQCSNYN